MYSPTAPEAPLRGTTGATPWTMRSADAVSRKLIGIGVAVAAAYVVAAKLGFRVAFVAEQVTTVWPPTGLAEAALLLWGRSLWPAVWLGAFITNAGTNVPLWGAASIATGNTIEAVVAASLLLRLKNFDPALRCVRDALAFIVLAGLLATVVSATIGSVILCAAGVQPWSRFSVLWPDWWLGDTVGALIAAPALLTIVRTPPVRLLRIRIETAALVLGCIATTQVVFQTTPGHHPLEYVVFPFVIAAAVRAGQPATSLVVLAASAVCIWNTSHNGGPFAGTDLHHGLILLQVFMGVLAGTGLLLAAAMDERKQIESAVAAEQRRTQAARLEAEAANRAKDEFLATLSHELRTPLNAILGWAHMLREGTLDEAKTRKALEVIDRNASFQVRLVEDILDISRIIAGGLKLETRALDLGAVINAAVDVIRPAAEARAITIDVQLAPSARQIDGDPQRLQQIVWNLVANSVKFTDPGGHIDVDLIDMGADGVRIRVRDSGLGIDPAFLPHVFERFRQADSTVSRAHGGLGIGLAIVRHLVELHGGRIRAESPGKGEGATFTIDLPRRTP